MTSMFYEYPAFVIALNKTIIFVNPNDMQIFKEVTLPDDLTEYGLKIAHHNDEEQQIKKSQQQQTTPYIQQVHLSPDRQMLAVTTSGQKAVLLYQERMEFSKLISVRPLSRASSALRFASDSKSLLVTDKTGDCYEYDCVNVKMEPRLLLGHLSIVYDILWTPDKKHIITCDRDDKIRVTNYPETYDIHVYCLGHKEFVTSLAHLEGHVVASVSGDMTLRLWNYETGKELIKFELPAPGIRLHIKSGSSPGKYTALIQLYQPNESVGLYELQSISETDQWQITQTTLLNIPDVIVNNLCFVDDYIYAACVADNRLKLKIFNSNGDDLKSKENWIKMVERQYEHHHYEPDNIAIRFKKHFDNVSDYLERKKRRIEEKQKCSEK